MNQMTPERILYYIDHITCIFEPQTFEDAQKMLDQIYRFAHIGTKRLHKCCQESGWEQEFLKAEDQLIANKHMKPYAERLAEHNALGEN